MAFGSLMLTAGFATALVWQSARGTVVPWVVQVDRLGQAQAVAPAIADYRPADPQIAWHLARFIEQVRAHSGRSDHRSAELAARLRIYDRSRRARRSTTMRARTILSPKSVNSRSPSTYPASSGRRLTVFRVAWTERRYQDGSARRDLALDRDPHRRDAATARCGPPPRQSAWNLRQRHQLVTGAWAMKPYFRNAGRPAFPTRVHPALGKSVALLLLLSHNGARRLRHHAEAAGDRL